jgi:hypothetical protein
MRFTYSYEAPDGSAFAPGALDAQIGCEVTVSASGIPPMTGVIVAADAPLLTSAVQVTAEIPDDSALGRAIRSWTERVNGRSDALGMPPGLRATGQPGERALSSPGGLAELLEGDGGQWRDQWSSRSWEAWRQLARLILDTEDPG